jgi:hypothetical protein
MVALLATPARINAPDSRFMIVDVVPVIVQAMPA